MGGTHRPIEDGLWADRETDTAGWADRRLDLSPQEVALLAALLDSRGRVAPRGDLSRRAGLSTMSPRRCDSVLMGLRQALGAESLTNVRGRGWRLAP